MFTGIVQGQASVIAVRDLPGLRSLDLAFEPGFCTGLEIGASVACDGVCLTVTRLVDARTATFDVMLQTLTLTTLGDLAVGARINVERAAREGAEIGGHPLSGHVDCTATLASVQQPTNNHVLRISVPAQWMAYLFAKGYVAVNGASLTIASADHQAGWFEVWLIPETLRMTTFGHKQAGDRLNIEIERSTQVIVDTVRTQLDILLSARLAQLQAELSSQLRAQLMAELRAELLGEVSGEVRGELAGKPGK
jgi:riboflavin synthase